MKNLSNLKSVILLLVAVIAFSSCNDIKKLVEQGRYDEAFSLAARKMAGKKKKKTKYVMAMETAFEKLTERDMQEIENLDLADNPQNWRKATRIYNRIQDRQDVLDPLLPLYDKDGYKADFRFVKVDGLMKEAKANAAAYLYESAKQLLAVAESGNKSAAREAFSELADLSKFSNAYTDVGLLKEKALQLGRSHVLIKMENKSQTILPAGFEREALRISTGNLDDRWRRYYTSKPANVDIDFNVTLFLTNIDISPERVIEREYIDEKEIQDGFEYVLDQNGNVLKDTLGNDIKTERFVLIRAFVLETRQMKEAIVSGYIEYFDNKEKKTYSSENFAVESIFSNYAATFQGDRRALSRQSRRNLGNIPLPFPSDENLLLDAASELKGISKDKIRHNSVAGL